jgi:hypothetical protein
VKVVLAELHGEHLGMNKTLKKMRQQHFWLHLGNDVERRCQQIETCTVSEGPRIGNHGVMSQCNIWTPFKKITINITVLFLENKRGNQCLMMPWTLSPGV